jgi:predicted nucleic acid-binding protein
MTVAVFLDTNILIYAASNQRTDARKRMRAAELIAETEFGTSAQVLAEFYVTVTRKGAPPMSPIKAMEWVEQLELQPCVSIDAALVKRGIENSAVHRISYWDGAIIAAAEALGATTLFTEDLGHGQAYGSVRAINPFLPA